MLPQSSLPKSPSLPNKIFEIGHLWRVSPYFLHLLSINENTQVWLDLLALYERSKSVKLGCFASWLRVPNWHLNWKTPYELLLDGEIKPLLEVFELP
jgi:hypothetical protein